MITMPRCWHGEGHPGIVRRVPRDYSAAATAPFWCCSQRGPIYNSGGVAPSIMSSQCYTWGLGVLVGFKIEVAVESS